MTSLIKNEFIKVFKKKSIYIIGLVIVAFAIFTNVIYKTAMNEQYYYDDYYYSETNIAYQKEHLESLNPDKASETSEYINLKTELEIAALVNKYGIKSWQNVVISNYLYEPILQKHTSQYKDKDDSLAKKYQNQIDELITKLDNNDWKYFAQMEKDENEQFLENLKNQLENTVDNVRKEELEKEIKQAELNFSASKLRLDKNINYSNSYMNTALEEYQDQKRILITYDGKTDLTHFEKVEIQNSQEAASLAKYVLDKEENIHKNDTLRTTILDINDNYFFLVLVAVIFIAGSIVADEFSKGTIKLLLIKPFRRDSILLAKLITALAMIPIVYFAIFIIQFIIGSLFFGLDSLSIPAVIYNFSTNSVQTISIYKYLLLDIIAAAPIIILLVIFAFALSTIFTTSALAIALPLVGMFASNIIYQLAINFDIEALKYFVSLNWDFRIMLFGRLPVFEYISPLFSAIICVIYLIIMIIPTFIIFKRKNIKNI